MNPPNCHVSDLFLLARPSGTKPGIRPFLVAAVPGTNLILVAALNSCPKVEQFDPFRTTPWEDVAVAEGLPLFRKVGAQWPRRRPSDCFRRDDGESKIKYCGAAGQVRGAIAVLGLAALAHFLAALRC